MSVWAAVVALCLVFADVGVLGVEYVLVFGLVEAVAVAALLAAAAEQAVGLVGLDLCC